jgi:hypothetical protein
MGTNAPVSDITEPARSSVSITDDDFTAAAEEEPFMLEEINKRKVSNQPEKRVTQKRKV